MATIAKCSQCKLAPRYALKDTDKICSKCKIRKTQPRLEDADNKTNDNNKQN